jgi:isopenicillin N synthase-like dioxygenase
MLPVIDLNNSDRDGLARELDGACRDFGFFYLIGHGLDTSLTDNLMRLARTFFAREHDEKMRIHMSRGGRAWRGYFPVGDELTSGYPDRKEGIYFGTELDEQDPRVQRGVPLHGRNQFPEVAGFDRAVLDYMHGVTDLGHRVLRLLAMALDLDTEFFTERYTQDPTILFRIFNYPAGSASDWGVGAHTDYGMLTFLAQDSIGGLQVRHGEGWLEVPDVPGSFVVNVGDMLERLTRGRYLSALHRVRNKSGQNRLSMALFFDPSFGAELVPIDGLATEQNPHTQVRWDDIDPNASLGTYGDYLLAKVSKVFPLLSASVRPR